MKIYISFLLVVALFTSCSTNTNDQNIDSLTSVSSSVRANEEVVKLTDQQAKIAEIKLGVPELKEINSRLKVNGVVEVPPQNVLSITFPLGGYIKSTRLIPGMQIKRGDVLATIEDNQLIQLQQDYLINKAKLEFAAADFSRQEALNKSKSNSDKVFQQARSDYQSQKIQVKALSEKLKLIGINPVKLDENNISRIIYLHAPVNAIVSKVNVNPGKYVNPTDVLFELINPSDIHLSLTVFEKDASMIKIGQKVSCFTSDNPDKKIDATVYLITPDINEDRSIEVHCHFSDLDKKIKPGTFIVAEIQSDSAKDNAVPDDAIVRWQDRYYLFVENSLHTYRLKEVEPGLSTQGFTAIKTDLGDKRVVVKNAYTLLMKLKNNAEEE